MNKLAIISSIAALGAVLAACNTAEKPAEVRHDVAKAEAKRSENVAEANRDGAKEIDRQQQDVNKQRRDVNEAEGDRNYAVAMAKAEGDYKVAKETCEALAGNAQKNCKDEAEVTFKSEKSRAELLKPKA